MLDLNLNVPSSAFLNMVPYTMPSLCNSQMDSSGSGSFGSSVVCVDVSTNTCDDDSCSYGDAYTDNFDMLKTNAVHDDHVSEAVEISKAEGDDACILVIQLFLSAGGGGNDLNELEVGHPFLNCSLKSWMNCSREDMGCGGMPELRKHSGLQQRHQIKKNRRGPKSQSSDYRDVTFYRRTGRWESHIWSGLWETSVLGKVGNIGYGGFDSAHDAARAHDRAAIKFRGVDADINFNIIDYDDDIKQMSNFTKEEFVDILRRQSTGFSRGSSKYRRVTLHKCGRWEARREQFLGEKAYDKAAMKWIGSEAVTNFEPSSYEREIISKADNEVYADGNQNLDLNLGIAPPCSSDSQKENLNLVSSFQDQRIRMTVLSSLPQDYRRLSGLAGCSAATFKHPSAWSSTNFLPSWKEREEYGSWSLAK